MISILPNTPDDLPCAQALGLQLNLPLLTDAQLTPVVLLVSGEDVWLRRLTPSVIDWRIDFASPTYKQSFSGRTRHNDPLSRAIGLHKKSDLRVLDMTAGLGKDALWLSECGAQVTLIERNPALAYLLTRAVGKIGSSMKVICEDAKVFLSNIQDDQFDVAYYDPMFDPRFKTALVKKDMQILQALHDQESPDPSLIPLAKKHIPKIVVKRSKSDSVLCEGVHHQLMTKVTRFDVY